MSAERLLVIGADAAGMSAAHQALRRAEKLGRELDVVALERTAHTSYSACGLPYWVAQDLQDPQQLVARNPQQHRQMGVDVHIGTTALELDLDRRLVIAETPDGQRSYGFDQLVLATGAGPVLPRWALADDGLLIPGTAPLKTWDDAQGWVDLLADSVAPATDRQLRAVVVGAGYIGLEMAEALLRRGHRVTVLTRRDVMSTLDPELCAAVREAMRRAGADVHVGVNVEQLGVGSDGRVNSVIADGQEHPADVVLLALGVVPAAELGAKAGLPVGERGGYLPDRRQQVADGVWAVGDCCESEHRLTGARVFVPLGTHANKQGRVAGENLAGGLAEFPGVIGTAITRFAAGGENVEIARTGLSTAEAAAAGLAFGSHLSPGRTASGYMPEASPMQTKLIAERGSRRLLGGQIVGGQGAGKRIDTLAMAIWAGQTVDDVASADLSYAPPFATVWEAVQLAARRLAERL